MCGIVGYVGERNAAPILMKGLEKLEYRGYDSAGIAVHDGKNVNIYKAKGRLKVLEERYPPSEVAGVLGIGHTRWATHGEPSELNSHPHVSGRIAVVHNGIIENYQRLKPWLEEKGFNFISETDTEVAAHLVNHFYEGNLLRALKKAVALLEGSFALGVLSADYPDTLVAVRKASPLIVGIGDNENFIASDIPAILEHTRKVYLLDDGDMVVLKKNDVRLYNSLGERIRKEIFHVTWDADMAEKGGWAHFMVKEINETPKVLHDTLLPRIDENGRFSLSEISGFAAMAGGLRRLFIIGCGTAYNAAMMGKYFIERTARIPVEVDYASEFRYRKPLIGRGDACIVISQSGETADTLAAMREAKKRGARVVAITNVVGSSVAREADEVFYTWAGPEIAVASTKAYSAQLMALFIIGTELAFRVGGIDEEQYSAMLSALIKIPEQVQRVLDNVARIQQVAAERFNAKNVFYIGRGMDCPLSMESALKLKEICYTHAEAFAAGELKHGPLALLERGTLVVSLMTEEALIDKTISNMIECRTRSAYILGIAMEGNIKAVETSDECIMIPRTMDCFAPMLAAVAAQLFAYYVAVQKGLDVDKPRNLAKSVTVE
ncbi:MAG: glutamine--fructose-6-phosphate transaminase (isomerizing) [Clostridia bacterium]|nr:glutamine--fructose-6-phosphate transaminase (isomerizing) [Clostridia bacterium]